MSADPAAAPGGGPDRRNTVTVSPRLTTAAAAGVWLCARVGGDCFAPVHRGTKPAAKTSLPATPERDSRTSGTVVGTGGEIVPLSLSVPTNPPSTPPLKVPLPARVTSPKGSGV